MQNFKNEATASIGITEDISEDQQHPSKQILTQS